VNRPGKRRLFATQFHIEGSAAFLEKREPDFS
jgi:1,4-dihydroxy-2-naphthoyl-CoA synthase